MEPDQQLRNLRDFLMVYNRMTEVCFQRCTSNFNYRNLTMDEERCVDSCAGKLIRSNHRIMASYVQLMPKMVQRRMDEMESKAAENAKAAEAAAATAAASLDPSAAEASSASQIAVDASFPTQIPALSSSLMTDVGLEAQGSVLKPVGLDIPVEVDSALSTSTAATEASFSAAAVLTPATETINLPVLNEAASGPSFTEAFPQPPIAGVQTDLGSSVSVLMPSTTSSLSEDIPVSIVSAPSLSSQERAPESPPPSGQ